MVQSLDGLCGFRPRLSGSDQVDRAVVDARGAEASRQEILFYRGGKGCD